jgi:hypothetical protein
MYTYMYVYIYIHGIGGSLRPFCVSTFCYVQQGKPSTLKSGTMSILSPDWVKKNVHPSVIQDLLAQDIHS